MTVPRRVLRISVGTQEASKGLVLAMCEPTRQTTARAELRLMKVYTEVSSPRAFQDPHAAWTLMLLPLALWKKKENASYCRARAREGQRGQDEACFDLALSLIFVFLHCSSLLAPLNSMQYMA